MAIQIYMLWAYILKGIAMAFAEIRLHGSAEYPR